VIDTLRSWRVGRTVGRTIYVQASQDGPSTADFLIGMLDTKELAMAAVRAHNAEVAEIKKMIETITEQSPWDKAQIALADLQKAMEDIPLYGPQYAPGHEQTAADACHQLIEAMKWNMQHIKAFLGPSPAGYNRG
jgi:hypothetical protein